MIISISSNGYTVKISTLGSELKSFRNNLEREYIWNSNPKYWPRSSPILFPTIGNVRNDLTIFEGRIYNMPKHGFLRDLEFKVLDSGCDFATFGAEATNETKKYYPYAFKLTMEYRINNNILDILYTVINCDNKKMPFNIGAHPGFLCPIDNSESFSDYKVVFEKAEELMATVYDLEERNFKANKTLYLGRGDTINLDYSMFKNDALFFQDIDSKSLTLLNKDNSKGIRVDYPDFKSVALWTPMEGEAPFLCIEPWNGSAIYDDESDIFEEKRNIICLEPNLKKSFKLSISIVS